MLLLAIHWLRELAQRLLGLGVSLIHLIVSRVSGCCHHGVRFGPLDRLHVFASVVQVPTVTVHFHQLARLLADLDGHCVEA